MQNKSRQHQGLSNFLSRAWCKLTNETFPDEVLEARVLSELRNHVRYCGAIHVQVEGGHVLLVGTIIEKELEQVLRAVRRVPGVRSVENLLEVSQELAQMPEEVAEISPRHLRSAAAERLSHVG